MSGRNLTTNEETPAEIGSGGNDDLEPSQVAAVHSRYNPVGSTRLTQSGQHGYSVGYAKPPLQTRFQKGRSGNPQGRPKGSKTLKSLMQAALSAPVRITEGGEVKVIEQRAALLRALVARAIKGDNRSAALVLSLIERLGLTEQAGDEELTINITIGGEDPTSPR